MKRFEVSVGSHIEMLRLLKCLRKDAVIEITDFECFDDVDRLSLELTLCMVEQGFDNL